MYLLYLHYCTVLTAHCQNGCSLKSIELKPPENRATTSKCKHLTNLDQTRSPREGGGLKPGMDGSGRKWGQKKCPKLGIAFLHLSNSDGSIRSVAVAGFGILVRGRLVESLLRTPTISANASYSFWRWVYSRKKRPLSIFLVHSI